MAVNCQPITIKGDTTAAGNNCTAFPGSDLVFQVSVPCDGLWTFSVDDGDVWNSVVSVGTTSCGAQLGVGATGELSVSLTAGTYFLTVDGNTASDEGGFLLQVFLALPPIDRVTDLGKFGTDRWDVLASGSFGINNAGQVAYAALDGGNNLVARVWDGSAIIVLGFPGSSGPPAVARDINEAGIAVGQVGGLVLAQGLAAVWSPSQPGPGYDAAAIAPFGGTSCPWSRGHAISNDGVPIVVLESDLTGQCFCQCDRGRQATTAVIRGFQTPYPDIMLAELANGGAFPCYVSTYARDVNTPASGPLCVVGFVNNVNAGLCAELCLTGADEHAALWQDAGLPQALAELDPLGSEALAVNDEGGIVGWGFVPAVDSSIPKAFLWTGQSHVLVVLGNTMPRGQGSNKSRAFGISNVVGGSVYVAGTNVSQNFALLWQRTSSGQVSVTNLNSRRVTRCEGVVLETAHDVNDSLEIIASGVLNGTDRHAYLLTPFVEPTCWADIDGSQTVDFADVLEVINAWGDRCQEGDIDCRKDLDLDCVIGTGDLIEILNNWGACISGPQPDSVQTVIEAMGLSYPDDWHDFLDTMANGTAADQQNDVCWMQHYFQFHYLNPPCLCPPNCPGPDPWGGNHNPF